MLRRPKRPKERANLQHFLDSETMKQGESFFMGRTSVKGPIGVVAELRV